MPREIQNLLRILFSGTPDWSGLISQSASQGQSGPRVGGQQDQLKSSRVCKGSRREERDREV